MTTLKAALRQLTDKKSKALPPMPPPEDITGKRSALIWGTEGSGAGGGSAAGAAAAVAAGEDDYQLETLQEIPGTRIYYPSVDVYNMSGSAYASVSPIKSIQVRDQKDRLYEIEFLNPYA